MRFPGHLRAVNIGIALASGLLASGLASAQGQPVAPLRPVTNDYFAGTQVVEPTTATWKTSATRR